MIVAIDGPAGSGKSTTAREVAHRLGMLHVDSGAFYRALTHALLARGTPESAWDGITPDQLDALRVEASREGGRLRLSAADRPLDAELRTAEINAHVSHVARIPVVREWLLGRLRELAGTEDVVVDGRDIGTVVFPDAELKVYLLASAEVRAERRLKESGRDTPDRDALLDEIERLRERDRQDSQRAVAPLRAAEDAVRVDTTALTFEEQVGAILELARGRGADLAPTTG